MPPWAIAITVANLAILLRAEYRVTRPLGDVPQNRLWIWLSKPMASLGFIMMSLTCGATDTAYGNLVLTAQALAWVGDVLLIPKRQGTFLAGLVAFLLGHCVYIAAFMGLGITMGVASGALVVLCGVAVVVYRWLMVHVPRPLRIPVNAYIMVSTIMVAAGIGAARPPHAIALMAGVLFFYLSDLCVARHEFVEKSYLNKLLGLPLYYAAQLLLASSVGS